jgi:hypothetical protein
MIAKSSLNRNFVLQSFLPPIAGGACEAFVPDATDDGGGPASYDFGAALKGENFFTPNARNPLKRFDSKK